MSAESVPFLPDCYFMTYPDGVELPAGVATAAQINLRTFWQVCRCGAVFQGQGEAFNIAREAARQHICKEQI